MTNTTELSCSAVVLNRSEECVISPGKNHNWLPECQMDPHEEPASCHSYRSWWSAPYCCGSKWVGFGPYLASPLQKRHISMHYLFHYFEIINKHIKSFVSK